MKIKLVCIVFLICFISCHNESELRADKDNGGLLLPDGFRALVVADSVGPTRHLAVNSNGDIYVKLRIIDGDLGNVAIRDTNKDGKADIIKRFGDYPNDGSFATEMRIHNGYLYFSSERVVYRQKLSATELIPEDRPEVIMVDHHPIQWHNAKSLAFDGRGGMFVTFSAPTNVCEDWNSIAFYDGNNSAGVKGFDPCQQLFDQGGIWRFDENKLNQTQADGVRYATGIRSVVGMAWNEVDSSLYALQHGRDYLYNHSPLDYSAWQNAILPAEEFMNIKEGDDFGWPYTYFDHIKGKRMWAPEYGGDGVKVSNDFKLPVMGFPAHMAPNDLLFYKGDQFPTRYKNGAFIAFHGSTNRGPYPQAGYIVAFAPFENGKITGQWEVFADGFTGVDTVARMEEAKYRPMGLSEGPDGSLYVSESKNGKIWRIIFRGDKSTFGMNELKKMEQSKLKTYVKDPDEVRDNLLLR